MVSATTQRGPRHDRDGQRPYQLKDRVTRDDTTVLMTGVQALARIPVEQLRVDRAAGHDTAAFAAGYPGSPLAGLDLELERAARLAPDLPMVLRPALNEELGVSAVMGSQLAAARPDARRDGVIGIWYGKSPGLDRSSDALRHAVFAGTSPLGGAVAVVGDDPEAKSSTLPSSSDATFCDLHLPILYPADVREALDLGRHAIALSRASGLWVGLKVVSAVADGSATVELDPHRVRPVLPRLDGGEPYVCRPDGNLLGAHSLGIERELRGERTELAIAYGTVNGLNRTTVECSDAWLGIVASGLTYRELRAALDRLGLDDEALSAGGVRVLQMQMPVPFDPDVVRRFARGLEEVMVVEEMNPTLERLVRDALFDRHRRPAVTGKLDRHGRPQFPSAGPLYADAMLAPLRAALSERLGGAMTPPPPPPRERVRIPLAESRTPYFCSGCPHNRSTRVPEGTVVGAGIGCHTMAMLGDDERLGEIVCISAMGNEGAPWIGMSEFVATPHFTQNLGDGTYFHSGQLAVQAAVDAGVDMTFKLLFNGHVAMTGGQRPPGQRDVGSLTSVLLAQGVARVIVTTDDPGRRRPGLPRGVEVWDRTRLEEAQAALAATPGVTVLVHDQECAAELRRARRRGEAEAPADRVVINEAICEGCGDCAEVSSCLAVQPVDTPLGRKTRIDQGGCNLDHSCVEGDCPSFVMVRPAGPGRRRRLAGRLRRNRTPPEPPQPAAAAPADGGPPPVPDGLPDPPPAGAGSAPVRVRMAGIGGTGVVTAAQVVATAAMLDGLAVSGLDQTGLSQKAGPVVSDLCLGGDGAPASNHLGAGQADVLVAFDGLVAASDGPLAAADPSRTALVASTSDTPTASRVLHPADVRGDAGAVWARLESSCRPGAHLVDAASAAGTLVGNPAAANLLLLGAALQAGHLPVSPGALAEAITLNDVAVGDNTAALAWGRLSVARPAEFRAALRSPGRAPAAGPTGAAGRGAGRVDGRPTASPAPPRVVADTEAALAALGAPAELLAAYRLRGLELVRFQDEHLASTHAHRVLAAAAREQEVAAGRWDLTTAVCVELHRVMAYKDEYEVARLLTDPGTRRAAESAVGGPARASWMLHPPLLRALGMRRKVAVSTRAAPVMALLARGRRLRGTAWDPFGHSAVRRAERALARDHLTLVDEVVATVGPHDHSAAVELVSLTGDVRGFEDRKLEGIRRYRERAGSLAAHFRAGAALP